VRRKLIKKKENDMEPIDFKFNLGDILKDRITGFEGVVICRAQWLANCNTYGLQSQKLKEAKPLERQHFDEPNLEPVGRNIYKAVRGTGGPERPVTQTNR